MRISKNNNILFLFHYSGLNNGAVRSMCDVIENLVKKYDMKVTVAYPDKKGTSINKLESIGVHCYKIPYGRWDYIIKASVCKHILEIFRIVLKYIQTIIYIPKIHWIIKKENIDIIYTNTTVVYLGAILNKIYGIKHVWHIREFGKEDHGLGYFPNRKKLISSIDKYTQSVIYISQAIENKYKKEICNSVPQYVVYNDISKEFINPRNNFNFNEKLKIAIIGSIQEGKGQLDVIKAINILCERGINTELHIGGQTSGEYYELLHKYVEEHELSDCVFFDGFITDVNSYRSKMDVGVVASKQEAFGRVTVEGMLSMMAMIGADSAGTSEIIESDKNGLLYCDGDIFDLANKIELLEKNRYYMRELALNGFEYASKKYTESKAADKIYEIVQNI